MSKSKENPEVMHDLRDGVRGTLVVHEPNLAGASPQHTLNNPDIVQPGVHQAPPGHATHG